MTFDRGDGTTRRSGLPSSSSGARDVDDAAPRDWKRSVLIAGLGILSWVATYVGMLELIEANMGDLPIVHRMIVGFSVAMLMVMIIWLLDQLFKPHTFFTKLCYAAGYVFLSLISIGFGFGFYWKVLESRGEASRSAESAVSQVQNSLQAASTRLEQLQSTLVQLTGISTEKAEIERSKGTSCPNSKPGDGPRRKMRDEDAQRFTFASEFVKGRVGTIKGDLSALDGDLLKITSADASTIDAKTGTRNEFMKALGRKLDLTVTGFNAFRTDPQLRQIRSDLADRAERTTVSDGRGATISCPDAQLQTALRGVVKAIDQLPELTKPEIAAVEGSEATIEAFRRLTTTFYGALAFKLPPTADELRELQKKAIQSVEDPASGGASQASLRTLNAEQGGLSKRDYVPLAVAVFVDLCLLLVSMVQRSPDRLGTLLPKMQAAERGPVIQILSRFNEIHRDGAVRENFEIFRHVVFDMHGDYYVAVPLDAPPRLNPDQREALRVEAQLLANLFASFEREKIFKRTMLPTTASIQKRLARQGSKFAGSEAFRVYKFADGAWSDIILGAVMGAARRIEDADTATGPTTTIGNAPSASQPPSPLSRRAAVDTAYEPALSSPAVAPASVLTSTPRRRVTEAAESIATAFAARSGSAERRAKAERARSDPEHAERFGPYAQTYQPYPPAYATAPQGPRIPWPAPPPPPEADVSVRAANSNTMPVTAPMPIGSDETRVVTLSRETATVSLPMSDPMMPPSLKDALERIKQAASEIGARDVSPRGHIQTLNFDVEPLDDITPRIENRDPSEFTANDLALIGRMAPPAAE